MAPTRIVILGGGFGGAYAAQALEKKLRHLDAEIVLLDRNNYFVFYPLLIEAGTGSLEPRHAVVPIREFLRRTTFHMAEVRSIDVANQHVEYCAVGEMDVTRLRYDHLVIALGSVTKLPPESIVPGAREHCSQIKSLTDAVALRDRAIVLLEMADASDDESRRRELLRIVIVGGSFTGVELAGEYEAFIRGAARRYRNVKPADISVTLVEMEHRVLGALGDELADFAARHLRKRGLDLRLGVTVSSVASDNVVLSDGTTIPTRTVIWCAGISPNPLVTALGLPLDKRGYILCERDLRVHGCDNIWSIGDIAVNPNDDGTPQPATAQHAVRQGAHVARNIAAVLAGRPTQPCSITTQGMLAAIGCRTAVGKVFGVRIAGFPAWWMWRTVYLLKMPRLGRKVRVALDWTVDLFFKRDYVQLGVHRLPTSEPRCADVPKQRTQQPQHS
jgi:NADH dehydrogenase